jgi:hypothetical protein
MAKEQRAKGNEDLADKIMLFDKLPDQCYMCESTFDKTDKQMVSSWNVVVKEAQQKVSLYCPTCWTMAQEMVSKVLESIEEVQKMEEKVK